MSRALSAAIALVCICVSSLAATSVPVTLTCWSPHIYPAEAEDDFGIEWRLEISSIPDENRVNGELQISGNENPYTHEGYFLFENLFSVEPAIVDFVLDMPMANENGNALFDLFEFDRTIEGETTEGAYVNPLTGEEAYFYAVWYRAENESTGWVELNFPDLGLSFQHGFEILAFSGTFSFTKNGSLLEGSIAMAGAVNSEETIEGPFTVTIVNTGTLTYESGEFVAPNDVIYSYLPGDEFENFDLLYLSILIFLDGLPATGDADYQFWLFEIEATDENGNEIPDLVEDSAPPVDPPSLEARKVAEGIEITITGAAGESYSLQAKTALGDDWSHVQSISLSSTVQSITLAADGSSRYFRVEHVQ